MTTTTGRLRQRQPHIVCKGEEMPPGTVRRLTLGRRQIAVANVPGEGYVALANYCPHQGGPLDAGVFEPMWVADNVGEHIRDNGRWVLVCPYHNFEVDVQTGCPVAPLGDRKAVTYRVTVEDGNVVVYV